MTKQFAIVISQFNEEVTSLLLKGSLFALKSHGIKEECITLTYVPGAFEAPLVAKKLASSKIFSAVICLGAVIRGDTPHFEYISQSCSLGIMQASLETGIPILFGILTTNTDAQAEERAKGERNKGYEVAISALQMANLMESLPCEMSIVEQTP